MCIERVVCAVCMLPAMLDCPPQKPGTGAKKDELTAARLRELIRRRVLAKSTSPSRRRIFGLKLLSGFVCPLCLAAQGCRSQSRLLPIETPSSGMTQQIQMRTHASNCFLGEIVPQGRFWSRFPSSDLLIGCWVVRFWDSGIIGCGRSAEECLPNDCGCMDEAVPWMPPFVGRMLLPFFCALQLPGVIVFTVSGSYQSQKWGCFP